LQIVCGQNKREYDVIALYFLDEEYFDDKLWNYHAKEIDRIRELNP